VNVVGSHLSLSGYNLSALLTDSSRVATSPNPTVAITDEEAGLALVTVQVPMSPGRYRLSVRREKGPNERVTHGVVVLNVVKR
jgi:hypothetical protein